MNEIKICPIGKIVNGSEIKIVLDQKYAEALKGLDGFSHVQILWWMGGLPPIWNERTNRFYKKCGYTEIGRDDESVYYEKRASQSSACTQRAL